MRHRFSLPAVLGFCALACAFLMTAGSVRAQSHVSAAYLFEPGTIALTLSGGGAAFTDFQQNDLRLIARNGSSADHVRRISGQTTGTASAALTFWLSSSVGIAVSAGYTPTHFRITTDGDAPAGQFVNPADTTSYANLKLWDVSGNVLLRPVIKLGRVYPYAILGGGILHYTAQDSAALIPIEARTAFAHSQTKGMATLGVGAVIPLQRKHFLLSFDLTDRVSRTPVEPGSTTIIEDEHGAVSLNGPPTTTAGAVTLTSNLRLTVGLTVPLHLR